MNPAVFLHRQLTVDGVFLHVISAGRPDKPALFFLHGFPENWQAFEAVMSGLCNDFHVIAMDLPGIGKSGKIASSDKRTIAGYVKGVINALEITDVTLVGQDVGGMITYAYLKSFPNELSKAVIMNVGIPGVDPWPQIKQNPRIWHFQFHNIPDLPEALVSGKQRTYFDYFYNTIAAKPDRISDNARDAFAEAYTSADALHTGFEWYRTFEQDEKDNVITRENQIQTPVLYLRGEKEYGKLDLYLDGFRASGLVNVQGQIIPGSGHYAPEEATDEVVTFLKEFMTETKK
ncbi:alpha/beta hydrolase [Larkinella terrae]|nr:alpha/beta hydrolase [Larkinella terrae]